MIDYDSFSRCHLTDIFFAFHVGAKELSTVNRKNRKKLKHLEPIAKGKNK